MAGEEQRRGTDSSVDQVSGAEHASHGVLRLAFGHLIEVVCLPLIYVRHTLQSLDPQRRVRLDEAIDLGVQHLASRFLGEQLVVACNEFSTATSHASTPGNVVSSESSGPTPDQVGDFPEQLVMGETFVEGLTPS